MYAHGSDKTHFTLPMLLASTAQRDEMIDLGAIEGEKQTLDRLEVHLAGGQ